MQGVANLVSLCWKWQVSKTWLLSEILSNLLKDERSISENSQFRHCDIIEVAGIFL